MKLVDLSLAMKHGSLSYPGTSVGVVLERVPFDAPGSTLSRLTHFDPHCGTHFDSPLHFIPTGSDVASTELKLPEIVVISSAENPIPATALSHTPALEGKAVLFSTGWDRLAGTTDFFKNYPVLSTQLAEELASRRVAMVGLDSPSADPTISDYSAHRTLLSAGIPILEGLVNLPVLIPYLEAGDTIYLAAFPLRIQGLEGSPVRAVALVH